MEISYRISFINGHSTYWATDTEWKIKSKEQLMNIIHKMKYNPNHSGQYIVTESYDEYNVLDGEIIMIFNIDPENNINFIYCK
jgi:hypothetical protein